MLDDMFSFMDTDMVGEDEFALLGTVEMLFESPEQFRAEYDGKEDALSRKVKDIIEKEWGKRMEDVRDLHIGRFHERLVQDGHVSYKSTDSFLLQVQFFTALSPRRITFTLTV